ncbi:M23 family metallopeptidase [Pseudomonas jinjuensis]|uniref:Hydroxyethylthiazole kinase n=1 Tax=Pseudomonas jinjuensis TaxID=198616 RepID=A0A1H0PMH3_9PSED|nr:M23 family metallopeptidase [Pseudomonas jinjuensis]SDP05990.1 hypothetical protein SAMN05216193_12117 [Pseudomonas jinjuensis]
MIISPPFLPTSNPGEPDSAYLNRAMLEGIPGNGGFPVSYDLNWHGGVHLTAPMESGAPLPVRAVADGTLAYVRQPTARSSDENHALNYGGAWTDDGCIVLRHETEIGEGDTAHVVFFSVYQHLSTIKLSDPVVGGKIYRKDELGQAGSIREPGTAKIHFEIIAAEAASLIGRTSAKLDHQSSDGRKDSCWGDAHFHLPPEVLCYEQRPASWVSSDNSTAAIVTRPAQSLFIRLRYAKGQCTLTTITEAGEVLGERAEVTDFEYELYQTACDRYPACPSAGYELLRWGRVLGPDPLRPAQAAHWRQISLPSGPAWVNLNATTVTCFSDADFPHWLGWQLVDDDTDDDSHCQSAIVRAVLKLDEDPLFPDGTDAISIANSPSYGGLPAEEKDWLGERYEIEQERNVAKLSECYQHLKRFAFKFPTEWRHEGFDARYGWWTRIFHNDEAAVQSYEKLKAHQKALAFWEEAALDGIGSTHWHFPPRQFIEAFRRCGWLSQTELTQLLPMTALRKAHGQWVSEPVAYPGPIRGRMEERRAALNKALRIFAVSSSPLRLAAFFGNAMQETQWFAKLHEDNSGAWYFPWDGRGFLQLTHADNYIKYWRFRGRVVSETLRQQLRNAAVTAHQQNCNNALRDSNFSGLTPEMIRWRNSVERDSFDAANSACAYWSWTKAAVFADQSPVMVRQVVSGADAFVYYSSIPFGQVAATVNFGNPTTTTSAISGVNGIQARYQAYISALMVLSEGLRFTDIHGQEYEYPEGCTPRRI